MKSTSFLSIIFSFFLLSYFIAPHVFAQQAIGLSSGDISVDVEPQNPGPNTLVTVSINSFATDLNASQVSWTVNGTSVASGTGVKQISLTTGALGKKTTVDIDISSPNGDVSESLSIVPATVDLMWEAHTYTPPFFKGKPLFSDGSAITFIAMPHIVSGGQEVPASNLIYKWSNNGTVLGDQGGYGKSTLTLAGALLPRPMDVTVEASDPISGAIADGETVITPQAPSVVLYQNDPLYGVEYEHALGTGLTLSGQELDIAAVPYYFTADKAASSVLSYAWQVNGEDAKDNGPTEAFRTTSTTGGSSSISLQVTVPQLMFQTAYTSLYINFPKAAAPTSSL
jgi:hypothetical protein